MKKYIFNQPTGLVQKTLCPNSKIVSTVREKFTASGSELWTVLEVPGGYRCARIYPYNYCFALQRSRVQAIEQLISI